MKNILVPCDFSHRSVDAFKTAINIALRTNGRITVLNVFYIPTEDLAMVADSAAYDPGVLSAMTSEVRSSFERMVATNPHGTLRISLETTTGSVLEGIKRTIAQHNIDLVVMGTSGASGLKEMLIGSNTEKVVRHSPVPVLAVRETMSVGSVKNILIPVNFPFEHEDFIKRAIELQWFFGARLHFLFVNTDVSRFIPDDAARKQYVEFVKFYQIENCEFHFRTHNQVEDMIVTYAADKEMDLIVMGTHARKGLSHVFNGSVTENVVNHVTAPIWTCALNTPAAQSVKH